MPRPRSSPFPPATVLAALFLGGCGGAGEPIPAASAQALIAGIDRVEERVRAGECRSTRSTLRRLERTARALPEDVDPELRGTLVGGVEQLGELVRTQCRQKRPKPKPVEEEPAEPVFAAPVEQEPEPEPSAEEEPGYRETEPEAEEPAPREEPQDREPTDEESQGEEPSGGEEPEEKDPGSGGGGVDPCPPGSSDRC